MPDLYDIIIIGGGPAGLGAALYGARGRYSTLVIEKAAPGGMILHTAQVDDYPGHVDGIGGPALGTAMWQQVTKFGAETLTAEVTDIEMEGHLKVVHSSKGDFRAKVVILATGGLRRRLGVPGERELAGKGVYDYAFHDAKKVAGKAVVVIGGGDSAFSEAIQLSQHASKVTIIHRREDFRAIAALVNDAQAHENIEYLRSSAVTAVLGGRKVTGVAVRNLSSNQESTIPADAVFIHIGYDPSTSLIKDLAPLEPDGHVATDEWMTTPAPGVFVAGDVRVDSAQQVITAAGDGATAAIAADHYLSGAE